MNSAETSVIHLFMSIGLFYNHVLHEKVLQEVKTNIVFWAISRTAACYKNVIFCRCDQFYRLVLFSNPFKKEKIKCKQRFETARYFVHVYSFFLYLTISDGHIYIYIHIYIKVIILSVNSFFLSCCHLGSHCLMFYIFNPFQLQTQAATEEKGILVTHTKLVVIFQNSAV